MKFFTSDLHLGHKKIAEYSGYPHVDLMNLAIIQAPLDVRQPNDDLYILGDLSFCNADITNKFLSRLKGINLYLILGNHDNEKLIKKISHHFVWIKDYYHMKIKDEDKNQHLILFHYPMLTWDRAHYGTWQIHGHCHGSLFDDHESTRIDVGWDVWCRPIAFEDIKRYMWSRDYKVVDHHHYGSEG